MFNIKTKELLISKENPQNEIWDLIYFHTNSTNLKCNGFINKPINHIQYLRDQSYEFISSEKNVTSKTSPLLLFYGCMHLAKLLILIKKIKKGIETLHQGHGLKFKIEKKDFSKNVLNNCHVEIENSGTFIELLNVFREGSEVEKYRKKSITLNELFNRYVDIYDYFDNNNEIMPISSYELFDNPPKKANVVTIGIDNSKKYTLLLELYGGDEEDNLQKYIKKYPNHSLEKFMVSKIRIHGINRKTGASIGNNPYCLPINYFFDVKEELPLLNIHTNYEGNSYLISPIKFAEENLVFNQIEIQYMILFIFSNLVRYYADKWKEVVDNEIFWNIKKSLIYISRSFPNNILNEIIDKNCIVLSPGILKRYFFI